MKQMNRMLLGSLVSLTVGMGIGGAPALGQETSPTPAATTNDTEPATTDAGTPGASASGYIAPMPAVDIDKAVVAPILNDKSRPRKGIPLVSKAPVWNSFHGQLNAQKYSPLDEINKGNVDKLEKVWEIHTGDVSDGSGDKPATVWSATPIFANNTLYIGTPFYRILALDPATGKEKWSFDTQSTLKALTQPALKNRGVAYWQTDNPVAGEPCQKIVYIGTMDARLFAVDADSGKACDGFADHGVLDVNQWNTRPDRFPLSLLQPPTVAGNHLIMGWAGKDWEFAEAPPGAVFSVDPQTGALQWAFNTIPESIRRQTGTANVWTAMSVDEDLGLVYLAGCLARRPIIGAATANSRSPTPLPLRLWIWKPARSSGHANGCITTSGTMTSTPPPH
ncbi:PQQ-binding-like beta-propeller repeat protein [uncultured Cohaesibacter sp.]|uniref:outer membrane protein assembly factor BamB family protein n=1 Tax=uncultured Cohaesibacter sp. TaxID=1002546 RepID=UPI0029C7366C|nr:PQQ-binding-like beta-propeller repeat protein [uncultured Cohaesibacter sp.]